MNSLRLVPVILAILGFTTALVASDRFSAVEKSSKSYPISAHGTLRLADVSGSIEITAWDKNEVLIESEKRAANSDDLARIHIDIDAQPDAIVVATSHEKTGFLNTSSVRGEVRYTVKVPAGITLEKISSVNSVITVKEVRGPVKVQTVNGAIRASGLANNARLETVNGSISARFAAVTPDQQIEVESVNGSCEVFLPKEIGAQVTLSSVNGRASCDFPITLERSTRRTLRGTIGTGAVVVKASTINGSVRLNRL